MAFNVIGLKSALMVGALTCKTQDKYDAFMNSFQPHILAQQHVIDAYFKRIANRTKEDVFVTSLANDQSITGLGEGAAFCLNNQAEYDAVLSLKTTDQLDAFAAGGATPPMTPPAATPAPAAASQH